MLYSTAPRKAALAMMLCGALAACGGGGGGGGGTPTPSNPGTSGSDTVSQSPVPTAITTAAIQGRATGAAAAARAASVLTPQSSSPIIYDRKSPQRIWVVNPDQGSVSVIDSSTRRLIGEIPVGDGPRTLALDNAGNIWVSNRHSGTLSIIDPDSLSVATTLTLSSAAEPYGIVNAPDGSGIWVSLLGSQEILRFDPVSRQIKQRHYVGPDVRHLAISADSQRLLASRFISPPLPGENTIAPRITGEGVRGGEVLVYRLQAGNATPIDTVSLAVSQVEDTGTSGGGLPNYLGAPAISPDGKTAWVPSKQDNIMRGMMRNQKHLDYQNTVRAVLSKIDLESTRPTEDLTARVDLDNTSLSSAITYTPDGRYMAVALETSRELAIVNAITGIEEVRLVLGGSVAPQGVAFSADGSQLAISTFMTRDVRLLDTSQLVAGNPTSLPNSTTRVATLNTPEKLADDILLGKQLFYDAFDPRLSRDRYMSCAACHNDGYGDGRVWDMSGFGEGLRKTISLQGHGGKKKLLHWSGNFDEVQDFEQQIRALAGGSGLLADGYFRSLAGAPLGSPKVGLSEELDALAAYVDSLSSYGPSPFRPLDRSLSADAQAGEALFSNKTCTSCHGSEDLGGDGSKRENIGTLSAGSGAVSGQPLEGIVTPGLRDAWYNAPYLHDGSAATLEAAIEAHRDISLTETDIRQLSAYILELGNGE
ncbi:MAG: cytochrome c peroxidase [Lautropia sp.]|nr:cytochrome c peroxidase [Lautropia sp.]